MRKTILLVLVLLTASLVAAVPSITNFQQFFGEVQDLPEGTFHLQVVAAGIPLEPVEILAGGRYGTSSPFKVVATEGDQLDFYVVNEIGAQTYLGSATYTPKQVALFNLQYPTIQTDGPECSVDSDCFEGQICQQAQCLPSTVPANLEACLQEWECTSFGPCVAGRQARNCFDITSCENPSPIPKPETAQDCGSLQVPSSQRGTQPTPTVPSNTIPSRQPVTQTCSDGDEQCSGNNVQVCSDNTWETLEYCSNGCNSRTYTCNSAEPTEQEPGFPWFWIVVGVVVLAIIILIIILLKGKDSQPQQYQPSYYQQPPQR